MLEVIRPFEGDAIAGCQGLVKSGLHKKIPSKMNPAIRKGAKEPTLQGGCKCSCWLNG